MGKNVFSGFSGFVVPEGNKKITDVKIQEKWNFFFEELLSAIGLVGGFNDPERWGRKTIEEVYKSLSPNGISLTFRLDPNKVDGRVFGRIK